MFSADDFLAATQALMPRGRVWPNDSDAFQPQVLSGLAPTFAALSARSDYLITDAFPATTIELLPEWEATLDLPDPCTGEQPTIQARRDQVVARFAGRGGQSIAYFVQYAANLGYPITITEFTPFTFGETFGLPLYGPSWAFAWQVNAPTFTIERFKFGIDSFGEPFANWSTTALVCELTALKPAGTLILFNFS